MRECEECLECERSSGKAMISVFCEGVRGRGINSTGKTCEELMNKEEGEMGMQELMMHEK